MRAKIKTQAAVTLVISLFAFALLAVCMYCLSIGTAQLVLQKLSAQYGDFANTAILRSRLDGQSGNNDAAPDYLTYMQWSTAAQTANSFGIESGPSEHLPNVFREESYPLETAVAVYDKDGKVIAKSSDFFYTPYVSEEQWGSDAGDGAQLGFAVVPIDRSLLLERDKRTFKLYSGWLSGTYRAMRFTGVLKNGMLTPSKIEAITENDFRNAVDSTASTEHYIAEAGSEYTSRDYTISNIVRENNLAWHSIYENPEILGEQVSVYSTNASLSYYDGTGGAAYEALEAMEDSYIPGDTNVSAYASYGIDSSIFFSGRYFFEYATAEQPELKYYVVSAVAAQPLSIAMSELRNVYMLTFLIAVIGVLIVRAVIKRNITKPISAVVNGISQGFSIVDIYKIPSFCSEPTELARQYSDTRDKINIAKNEVGRLNTALDYAKVAEQNRRQMTSNIAHELKTPLAIIRSYSEGLREKIAEEKREQYLDIIISEAESMDAMIMEMLDLSRLEAGKVKLSRDDFSLAALTASVFEKLRRAADEKELNVTFETDDCTVTADEGRMAQVVTNLLSNAVKYTPSKGSIAVKIAKTGKHVSFFIENDSRPLTGESLSKLWDSFYRAEEARERGGTGLGLAIVKSIVELHGGKCRADNIKGGVKIGFTLP